MTAYTDDIGRHYQALWDSMVIRNPDAVKVIASKVLTYRDRYEKVELSTTVPWPFVAVVHYRESDLNFKAHLHNGDPLAARTVHVPKGRPIAGNPPFCWEDSAEDALRCEGLTTMERWDLPRYLFRLEAYNGWGYRNHGILSPYVWSFSNHYSRGKYVADGEWDSDAVDEQCGCAPLLRVLLDDHAFAFPKAG